MSIAIFVQISDWPSSPCNCADIAEAEDRRKSAAMVKILGSPEGLLAGTFRGSQGFR
jgi:hypothetical protein